MRISDALHGIALLYVETAPFIYYTESRLDYVDKMHAIFSEISLEHIRVITSAVTLTETLMKPLQVNDTALVQRYRSMFYQTQGITLIPITARIGDMAADLRARYNLLTPDALHVAAAIDASCDAFLTNDAAIKRVTEIPVLVLDELELDSSEN